MHRPTVVEHAMQGVQIGHAPQQVTAGLHALLRHRVRGGVQHQLDPLIVRQLGEKRRIALPRLVRLGEKGDELFRNFQKIRRRTGVLVEEAAHQAPPASLVIEAVQNRKAFFQEAVEVVEEQLAVDRQAPFLDAGRRRMAFRIAQMRGERTLQALEFRLAHQALRLTAERRCWASPMRPSSRFSSSTGGKLKSRSNSVGSTPNWS